MKSSADHRWNHERDDAEPRREVFEHCKFAQQRSEIGHSQRVLSWLSMALLNP